MKPLLALLLLAAPLHAFTVVKDVSLPPVEKLVLFDQAAPATRLAFFNKGTHAFERAAGGPLVLRIQNNDMVDAGFSWAADPALPPFFSVADHAAIIVTFRLEGANRRTLANGQTLSRRADNLWNTFVLFDEKKNAVARAGLAEGAPSGKTPSETVTLRIPMLVFTYWGENPRPPIHGFGFQWPAAANAPDTRDYTLIIERIVVAD